MRIYIYLGWIASKVKIPPSAFLEINLYIDFEALHSINWSELAINKGCLLSINFSASSVVHAAPSVIPSISIILDREPWNTYG